MNVWLQALGWIRLARKADAYLEDVGFRQEGLDQVLDLTSSLRPPPPGEVAASVAEMPAMGRQPGAVYSTSETASVSPAVLTSRTKPMSRA